MQNMDKQIVAGSKWFALSNSWFNKWRTWVYFDLIENAEEQVAESERVNPGPIDCSDIILKSPACSLEDPHADH